MSLSECDIPWINPFADQTNHHEKLNPSITRKIQKFCALSDLPQPSPQRSSFDAGFCRDYDDVEEEYPEHQLEEALHDMALRGELEDFLRVNTISLKDIQDDIGVLYGKCVKEDKPFKARVRRHSIGACEEIIKCPHSGCDKVFNRYYNFKSHLKTHTGEKPFHCPNCPLKFARSHDLKRHERIHLRDGFESNKCHNCGKCFSRSDALNRHLRLSTCRY